MYFQTSYMFMPGLQYCDARRIADLQQYAYVMEKRHRVCVVDPFEPIRRLAMAEKQPRNPEKPLTSFRISDILSAENDKCKQKKNGECAVQAGPQISENNRSRHGRERSNGSPAKRSRVDRLESESDNSANEQEPNSQRAIVRPWSVMARHDKTLSHRKPKRCVLEKSRSPEGRSNSTNSLSSEEARDYDSDCRPQQETLEHPKSSSRCECESDDEDVEIDVETCETEDSDVSLVANDRGDISPLDALVAMSSKTFMGLESFEDRQNRENDQHNKNQIPKKKRKTRTAFTNQQIYELEKRFILQKYLTPSDRDEIAAKLGLTCAQVITWFQNRRAKFKRDIEELKNDVGATSPKGSDN